MLEADIPPMQLHRGPGEWGALSATTGLGIGSVIYKASERLMSVQGTSDTCAARVQCVSGMCPICCAYNLCVSGTCILFFNYLLYTIKCIICIIKGVVQYKTKLKNNPNCVKCKKNILPFLIHCQSSDETLVDTLLFTSSRHVTTATNQLM